MLVLHCVVVELTQWIGNTVQLSGLSKFLSVLSKPLDMELQ